MSQLMMRKGYRGWAASVKWRAVGGDAIGRLRNQFATGRAAVESAPRAFADFGRFDSALPTVEQPGVIDGADARPVLPVGVVEPDRRRLLAPAGADRAPAHEAPAVVGGEGLDPQRDEEAPGGVAQRSDFAWEWAQGQRVAVSQ